MEEPPAPSTAPSPTRAVTVAFVTGLLAGILATHTVPALILLSRLQALPEAFPAIWPPGVDLRQMLAYTARLGAGASPYVGSNLYPPLAAVLFHPLLGISVASALALLSGLSLLAWAGLVFAVPIRASRGPDPFVVAACGAAGLLSPALLFELERGQWNAIATAAAVAGAALFRARPRLAIPALVLLTLGIQLKLYPAVYVLLLRRPGEPAARTIRRLAILATVNAALFFVLGPSVFLDFLAGVREQTVHPFTWHGNHSIRSFVLETASLSSSAALAQGGLALFVVAAVLSSVPSADSSDLLPPRLLLTLTLAALLLPAQSHDYKLVLLPGPLALFAGTLSPPCASGLRLRRIALAVSMGAAFATTFVPYGLKPALLGNNAPALLFLLAAATLTAGPAPSTDTSALPGAPA